MKVMLTRRDVLKQAGAVAALATTAPWWIVRRAHAQRREKLILCSIRTLSGCIEIPVIHRQRCPRRNTDRQALVPLTEHPHMFVTEEQAAVHLACAGKDRYRKITADR